jgi:hypothetical protein
MRFERAVGFRVICVSNVVDRFRLNLICAECLLMMIHHKVISRS